MKKKFLALFVGLLFSSQFVLAGGMQTYTKVHNSTDTVVIPNCTDLILSTGTTLTTTGAGHGVVTAAGGTGISSPLTTKGDVWGYSTANVRIPIGTNGQVLTADSAQIPGLKWNSLGAWNSKLYPTDAVGVLTDDGAGNLSWAAASGSSPLTTKGDLYGFSTTNDRLPVGTNGQILTADSTQSLGVKWATGGGGSMTWPDAAGVANYSGSSTWGTSYTVGTAANNLVQLNGSSQLPTVSGALLTNLPDLSGTYQAVSAKNAASGYAGLDANSSIPANALSGTFHGSTSYAIDAGNSYNGSVGIGTSDTSGLDPLLLIKSTGVSINKDTAILNPSSLGAEKITNPTFSSATGWTAGTGWTIDTSGHKAVHTSSSGSLTQTSAAMVTPIVAGEYYYLYITSDSFSGNLTVSCGGNTFDVITSAGYGTTLPSKIFKATTTDSLVFTADSGTLHINSVSLKKITGGALYAQASVTTPGTVDAGDVLNNGTHQINFGKENLANALTKLGDISIKQGTGLNVLVIGDSWSYNETGNGPEWSGWLHKYLTQSYGNSGAGYIAPFGAVPYNATVSEPTGAWSQYQGTQPTPDSSGSYPSGSGSFSITTVATSFIVHSILQAGGGDMTYTIDGGAPVTIHTAGTAGVQLTTISGLSNVSHTIVLTLPGGSGTILGGVECIRLCYDNGTQPGIHWNNVATGGLSVQSLASVDATKWKAEITQLGPPDLAVISMGVNDIASRTPAQYYADMATVVSRLQTVNPLMSILIMSPTDVSTAGMSAYIAQLKILARTYSLGLIDNYSLVGPYTVGEKWANGSHVSAQVHKVMADNMIAFLGLTIPQSNNGDTHYGRALPVASTPSTGGNNSAFGDQCLTSLTSGYSNVGIGAYVLPSLTTGSGNMGIGSNSLYTIIAGTNNVAIGQSAMLSATEVADNVCIGNSSGNHLAGALNGYGSTNVGIGRYSLGASSGGDCTTFDSVAIGANAMRYLQGGIYNTAIGGEAGFSLVNASYNTFIGNSSGNLTTGASNVYIGYGAGSKQTTGANQLIIDNKVQANPGAELTNALIYGTFAATANGQQLTVNAGTITQGGGTVGGLATIAAEATATLSGASTTITLSIPTGAKIIGAELRVDTLITSGDGATSWSAAYSGGNTTAITTAQAFTKNVKVYTLFNENAASALTTNTTNIAITPNSNTFSGGVVRAIVYYRKLVTMADAV